MNIRLLNEEDKYCLVFTVEKKKQLKSFKKKHDLKQGYYCYVGEHNKDVHTAGTILLLRRLREDKRIQEKVKKISEGVIDLKSNQNKVCGYLHYFSDNPLFQREFHEAISS